jgi:hemerythrin-like metal-binding protein
MAEEWTENLATDLASIDREHEVILSQLRALAQTTRGGDPDDRLVLTSLETLEQHVSDHFANEEAHMWAAEYPGVLTHTAEHGRIADAVVSLRRDIDIHGRDSEAIRAAARTLAKWVSHHTTTADRRFAEFMRHRRAR